MRFLISNSGEFEGCRDVRITVKSPTVHAIISCRWRLSHKRWMMRYCFVPQSTHSRNRPVTIISFKVVLKFVLACFLDGCLCALLISWRGLWRTCTNQKAAHPAHCQHEAMPWSPPGPL